MTVTDLSPPRSAKRLYTMKESGVYLGVSYWSVRDLVLNGTLPAVRIPAARIDAGPRRGEHGELPPERIRVEPTNPQLPARGMRRVLIDKEDLDRLIERWKESELVAAWRGTAG